MDRHVTSPFLYALAALLISACSGPQTIQPIADPAMLEQEVEKQKLLAFARDRDFNDRLQNVAWPLLLNSTTLCPGNTAPGLGFEFANAESVADDYLDAARDLYGIDDLLRVTHVTAGGPAQSAGIRVGDILLQVDGADLPSGKGAIRKSSRMFGESLTRHRILSLDVRRNDQRLNFPIVTQTVCRFRVNLDPTEEINAYADGDNIYVSRGMVRFADDDLKLSAVIAHELAHNAQEHATTRKKNYWLGAIADITIWGTTGHDTRGQYSKIGANSYSPAFEAEADYIGIYAMALADLDISAVADFWREIAADGLTDITAAYVSTHPSTPARVVAIENTVSEIEEQRRQGLSPLPKLERR